MSTSQVKIMRKHLVSTSVYPVNNSASKFLLVGYDLVKNQLEPVVKLSSSKGPGPTFRVEAWRRFCECSNSIREYLEGSNGKFSPISLSQQQIILFKTSYGKRSILIDNIRDEMTSDAAAEPAAKKVKTQYESGIVLQSTSFEGMVEVREAVNYKLEQLMKNKEAANRCLDSLIEYMKTVAAGDRQSMDGEHSISYKVSEVERSLRDGPTEYCQLVCGEVKKSYPTFGDDNCLSLTAELLSLCYDFVLNIVTGSE